MAGGLANWDTSTVHAIEFFIFSQNTTRQGVNRRVCSLGLLSSFELDTMMKSSVPPSAPVALPPLVATYVEATNSFDPKRLLATFAEDALVNDQLRDYWGKLAIRENGRNAISSASD